jgi:sodium-coupled neutral amino acid transporter 11
MATTASVAAAAAPPGATFLATCIGVSANLVGAGLLSLPYTLKRAGLVTGVVALTTMCALNGVSALVIARCCDLAGQYSYLAVGRASLGPAAGTAISGVMALYTMGSCVSFLVLLGDFLPALVCAGGCSGALGGVLGSRLALIPAVALAVLFPLALHRTLNALRFTSTLSAVCILYTALMIAARSVRGPLVPASQLALTTGAPGLFVSLPVSCVAMTLHYNIPKFYGELAGRSVPRFGGVIAASFGVVLGLYLVSIIERAWARSRLYIGDGTRYDRDTCVHNAHPSSC